MYIQGKLAGNKSSERSADLFSLVMTVFTRRISHFLKLVSGIL